MATAINRLGCIALRDTSRIPVRRKCISSTHYVRQFHTSPLHRDEETKKPVESTPSSFNRFRHELDSKDRKFYDSLTPDEQQQWEEEDKKAHEYMTSPAIESELQGIASRAANEANDESPHVQINIPKIKPGLMAMGEEDEQDSGEDEEYEGDDITSLGHANLEQHREMREYARIMAWEMPLLSKLAKPFHPPSLDSPLRFRYTTYMGETHPAQKKIVLEFCVRDLPHLTDPQRTKLIKLTGPRYNPDTDIVKMSCEMFETQAQNKRYLGDLVDTLMAEAQDGSDMFEDVPLDFRHHKVKRRVEFPEEWKLSEERSKGLESERKRREIEEEARVEEGRVLVGARIIEEAMAALPVVEESKVLVEAQQGKRGKAKMARASRRLR